MVEEWIEYSKQQPEDWMARRIIDHCDWVEDMNALHVAVTRNKVQILEKLIDAKAGMYILIMFIHNYLYTYM